MKQLAVLLAFATACGTEPALVDYESESAALTVGSVPGPTGSISGTTSLLHPSLQFGGSGFDRRLSVARGPAGTVHVTGITESSLPKLGTTALPPGMAIVARLTAAGAVMWTQALSLHEAVKVLADAQGRTYVLSFAFATNGRGDVSVNAFSPSGVVLWHRELAATRFSSNPDMALLPSGGVVVAAGFNGTATYVDPLTGASVMMSDGSPTGLGDGVLVARFDDTGTCTAFRLAASGPRIALSGVTADAYDRVTIVGVTEEARFRGGIFRYPADQQPAGFALQLEANDNFRWFTSFPALVGSGLPSIGINVASAADGSIWILSESASAHTWGTRTVAAGAFAGRITSTGALADAIAFSTNASPSSIAVTSRGAAVVGSFQRPIQLGTLSRTSPDGYNDVFIAELDTSATPLALSSYGGSRHQQPTGFAIDQTTGLVWLGLMFDEEVSWSLRHYTSWGRTDGLFARTRLMAP